MATSLVDLRAKCRDNMIKIDPNGRIWGDTVLDNFINRAYIQVQKDGNFEWRFNNDYYTVSSVQGQTEYDLPDDFIVATLFRYNQQFINPTSKITLFKQNSTFPSGIPYQYYIYGTKYGLYPTPAGVDQIEIYYNKKLPKLTDTQDTEYPEDFDDAIVSYVAYIAMTSVEKIPKAQICLQDYQMVMDTLKLSYLYNDVRGTRFINDRRNVDVYRDNALYFGSRY